MDTKNVTTGTPDAQVESPLFKMFGEILAPLNAAIDKELEKMGGSQGSPAPEASAPENWIPGASAPLPSPVDWTKPVRTKGAGRYPARILAIDYSLEKPIIAVLVGSGTRLSTNAESWQANGQYDSRTPGDCLDLENYTPAPEAAK